MPIYIYTAKTKEGDSKTGTQEAINKHELAGLLRQQGLILISAETAGAKKKITDYLTTESLNNMFGRVSLVEKMIFSRQLAVMIDAGLSLNQALEALAEQIKNPKFKKIISQIEENIRRGKSFSDSLAEYPKIFNTIYVNMVLVGESSGNLSQILKILAEQMRKDYELLRRVKGAMIYPAIIIITMIGIGIMMMIVVVPQLTEIFVELKIELPLSTRIIIGLSNFLKDNFILGLIVFIAFIVLLRFLVRIKGVKKALHKTYLHLPIFGQLIRKINSARFAGILSSLIDSGVTIVKSLQIVADTLGNIHFKESLLASAQQVQKGKELSKALADYKDLYTPMVIQMIEVGEKTGSMNKTLTNLANFYQEEIDSTTKNLSSVIEPVVMIIVGAAVGFFAISMIQPMYSMMGGL